MDEFKLINQIKEDLCYVSVNLPSELKSSRFPTQVHRKNLKATDPFGLPMNRAYVLPDFHNIMQGYVKPVDQPPREDEQVGV